MEIPSPIKQSDSDPKIKFAQPALSTTSDLRIKEVSYEDLTLMPLSNIPLLAIPKGNSILPKQSITKSPKVKTGFWMISVTGGYLANNANLSDDFSSIGNDVTSQYAEKNTSILDLKGGYYFNRKIGLKAGIGTYKMSEDYSFSESEWQYSLDSTYVKDITYIYDSTMTTIIDSVDMSYYSYETDSSYVTLSNVSGTNSLRVVRIPLYFSYMFKYKRFLIEPELFGSINFILNQQGTIAPGSTLIEYNDANPIYRKRFFSGGLGLNLHYHLSEHFLITGYGRYQQPFGNLYSAGYSKTISSFSFGGGLSFTF